MKTATILFTMLITIGITVRAQDDKSSFNDTFEISSPAEFNASVSDGFIHVNPKESNSIKINYIVRKGNSIVNISREELEAHLSIDIIQNSGLVDISVKHKKEFRWNDWKDSYNVSLEVYVPQNTSCNVQSSDGDIRVKGLSGRQKCRTSDGDIALYGINGNTEAQTSDGDITMQDIIGNVNLTTSDGDIKADNVEGDATFITSDGDVELYNIVGYISARTSDGDIYFKDIAGAFKGQTSDGDITGNIVKLNNELRLATSDGDIRVTVPKDLGMNIYLKGEDINANLDHFDGEAREHLIKGKVRGGGVQVELSASDGRVTLVHN